MGTPKKAAAPKKAAQPKAAAPAVAPHVTSVGNTCQYTPAENDKQLNGPGPFAAIITEVLEKGAVNLQVFSNSITGPFFYSNVAPGTGPGTWA